MVLVISDYVTGAYTNEQGDTIYNLISQPIYAGVNVTLSFKAIPSVSSSFLNSAFVPLFSQVSIEHVKKHLSIIDSNKFINQMVIKRFKQEQDDADSLELRQGCKTDKNEAVLI